MASKSRKKIVTPSVADYLSELEHPNKDAVLAVRKLILAIDPRIQEEVKWNAPSFYIAEHFATFRLQPAPVCQLILHAGSKVRKSKTPLAIPDPDGMLKWAGADRCVVSFSSGADAKAKSARLKVILASWIKLTGVDKNQNGDT